MEYQNGRAFYATLVAVAVEPTQLPVVAAYLVV
jgi:hypothetical protein